MHFKGSFSIAERLGNPSKKRVLVENFVIFSCCFDGSMSMQEDVMIHYQLWPQQHQHYILYILLSADDEHVQQRYLFIFFLSFFQKDIIHNINEYFYGTTPEPHIHTSTCQCVLHTTMPFTTSLNKHNNI